MEQLVYVAHDLFWTFLFALAVVGMIGAVQAREDRDAP